MYTSKKKNFFWSPTWKRASLVSKIMNGGGIVVDGELEMHYSQTKMNVVVFRPDPQPFNIYQVNIITQPIMTIVFQMDDTGHVHTLRGALGTELANNINILNYRLARIINDVQEGDQEYAVFSTVRHVFDGKKIIREDEDSGQIYYGTLYLNSTYDEMTQISEAVVNTGTLPEHGRGFVFTTYVEGSVLRIGNEEEFDLRGGELVSSDEE